MSTHQPDKEPSEPQEKEELGKEEVFDDDTNWFDNTSAEFKRLKESSDPEAADAVALMLFPEALERGTRLRAEAELARIDGLTKVGNYRAFEENLPRAVAASERAGRPFSIVFIDLVAFKEWNERYTHEGGNEVLTRFAGMLKESTRGDDLVYRVGGDEFAVVLPGTADGGLMVERLQKTVEENLIYGDTLEFYAACGTYQPSLDRRRSGEERTQVIERALRAGQEDLMDEKRRRRKPVKQYEDEPS